MRNRMACNGICASTSRVVEFKETIPSNPFILLINSIMTIIFRHNIFIPILAPSICFLWSQSYFLNIDYIILMMALSVRYKHQSHQGVIEFILILLAHISLTNIETLQKWHDVNWGKALVNDLSGWIWNSVKQNYVQKIWQILSINDQQIR